MLQGLLGRLRERDKETGLSPLQRGAAALDPLILPQMRMGEQIAQQGQQFVQSQRRNATIAEMQKRAEAGDTVAQRYLQGIESGALDMKTGFAGYLNEVAANERLAKQMAATAARAGVSSQGVQSSFKLPDNSGTVAIMRDGSTVVRTIGGTVLTGEEAEQFVREATANYNQSQKELYQGRAEGKGEGTIGTAQQIVQAQKEGAAKVKFIEELNGKRANIESTISNYQLALDALGQGAKTGRVVGMLPNITATAQMIETARQRLGLDVIGSVTFGALSEGELRLALDTGLPSANLSNAELTKWVTDRMEAQKKVLQALNETALYFSDPETTFQSYYTDFLGIEPRNAPAPTGGDPNNPLGL
jgi:hypothetical protein